MHAATSHVASAHRLAEDVAAFVPVFPSRHAREKRFWRPISPKLSGRHFFGVTMFAPSRFFSASDILRGCAGVRSVLNTSEDAHTESMSTFENDERLRGRRSKLSRDGSV